MPDTAMHNVPTLHPAFLMVLLIAFLFPPRQGTAFAAPKKRSTTQGLSPMGLQFLFLLPARLPALLLQRRINNRERALAANEIHVRDAQDRAQLVRRHLHRPWRR